MDWSRALCNKTLGSIWGWRPRATTVETYVGGGSDTAPPIQSATPCLMPEIQSMISFLEQHEKINDKSDRVGKLAFSHKPVAFVGKRDMTTLGNKDQA